MDKYLEELENRIHKQHIKVLEETILSVKGQKRWSLLERIALEYGYKPEDKDLYRYDKDYLMKIGGRTIYLENITYPSYKEIRTTFERKEKMGTNPSLIGNALTVGSGTLGGGILGYLLTQAGLNPLIMIPSIMIPLVVCLYEMIKQGIKESKQFEEIDKQLNKYRKNISYYDNAAKRFNYRLYEREAKKVSINA